MTYEFIRSNGQYLRAIKNLKKKIEEVGGEQCIEKLLKHSY